MRSVRSAARAYLLLLGVLPAILVIPAFGIDWANVGPAYDRFDLTLGAGQRTEIAGPLFYSQQQESTRLWAFPPLLSYTRDDEVDFQEFDFAYPMISYDRFGDEYRFQLTDCENKKYLAVL